MFPVTVNRLSANIDKDNEKPDRLRKRRTEPDTLGNDESVQKANG